MDAAERALENLVSETEIFRTAFLKELMNQMMTVKGTVRIHFVPLQKLITYKVYNNVILTSTRKEGYTLVYVNEQEVKIGIMFVNLDREQVLISVLGNSLEEAIEAFKKNLEYLVPVIKS